MAFRKSIRIAELRDRLTPEQEERSRVDYDPARGGWYRPKKAKEEMSKG